MKWLRRTGALLILALVGIAVAASFKPLPGEVPTPAGFNRNMALYVPADGTRLAVDVWLPETLQPGERIPTLVEGSRYWRDVGVTLTGRIINLFGGSPPGAAPDAYADYFTRRGYAYVKVEVRGTGASFGVHDAEYSLQEMADYAAVLDWIAAQPWSNGRAGSVGVSYNGTTAELMTTTRHPALKAAAPLYSDFDPQYHLVTPGGVYQPAFLGAWSDLVLAMDANNVCGVIGSERYLDCVIGRLFVAGAKPVDGPDGRDLLREAVAEHNSQDPRAMVQTLQYRDSSWGTASYSSLDNQAYARKPEIEASGVPLYVVAGWFDAATVEGALARFASFSNPQTVMLAPFSHGGGHDTDPFKVVDAPPVLSQREQLDRVEAFFAAHLKDEGEPPPNTLTYYIMGGDTWRTTDNWPPAGFAERRYYLAGDGQLADVPAPEAASTPYTVDFSAGTAPDTRWMTQLGGGDVSYPDRNAAAAKNAVFTTPPFAEDMELTGKATLTLHLTSDQPDGALHAYLDAVAPDGTAHYLTEGVLRLKHRKVSPEPPVYPHFGPYHSFLEKDAAPMPVGEPEAVALGFYATSVKIPAGYRLRLGLAGADATSFARVPEEGPAPNWLIHHGGALASELAVPLRAWE
ncbi:MAG: CocE/NonD family hydrolase [Pseudomonadales bacterium]